MGQYKCYQILLGPLHKVFTGHYEKNRGTLQSLIAAILDNLSTTSNSWSNQISLQNWSCSKHIWYQCAETVQFWRITILTPFSHDDSFTTSCTRVLSSAAFRKCLNLPRVSNIYCSCATLDCSYSPEKSCLDQLLIGFHSGIDLSTPVFEVNAYLLSQ